MGVNPMIGKELGNYVVRSLLGEGGMGAVFLAEHKFLGDRVAIKVLHGTYASNPEVTQRFFQEAKSSRDISHPNIIKILDFGQNPDGGLYLIMELLEGQSLSAALAGGVLGEAAAISIAVPIAEGLAAAHAKGITHRDLKPDNVFLVAEGVKILDFGIAKVLSASNKTSTGAMLGTPKYMAPEQAKGAKFTGPHTDVYALGVMLYEMVTGRPPLDGGDITELLAKVLFETPAPPSTLAPVSPGMEALILQCLEKDPTRRPASMAEVYQRLLSIAGPGQLRLSPASRTISHQMAVLPPPLRQSTTLSGGAGQMVAGPPSQAGATTASKGRPVVMALVGLGVLGLGGGVAAMYFKASSSSTTLQPPTAAAPTTPTTPANPPPSEPKVALPATVATAKVVLRSTPPGAKISVGDKAFGTTPTVLTLELPAQVRLTLSGYQPAQEVVSAAGELNVKLVANRAATKPASSSKPATGKKPAATGDTLD